jgi:hypothetical protein
MFNARSERKPLLFQLSLRNSELTNINLFKNRKYYDFKLLHKQSSETYKLIIVRV